MTNTENPRKYGNQEFGKNTTKIKLKCSKCLEEKPKEDLRQKRDGRIMVNICAKCDEKRS